MKRVLVILIAIVALYITPTYATVDYNEICDLLYPVGSYIETVDPNFDPNIAWSGEWKRETPGLVHVSAGTTYVVDGANNSNGDLTGIKDGGRTDNIVPSHYHSFPSRGASIGGESTGHYHTIGYTVNNKKGSGGVNQTLDYGSGSAQANDKTTTGRNADHAHSGSVGAVTTGGTGTGAGTNLMPYRAIYKWKRVG